LHAPEHGHHRDPDEQPLQHAGVFERDEVAEGADETEPRLLEQNSEDNPTAMETPT